MDWYRRDMPKAVANLRKLGITPAREDLAPILGWEAELWTWYTRLSRQWRLASTSVPTAAGPLVHTVRVGIDLTVWLPVIQQQGWDMATAMELLSAIEDGFLTEPDPPETPNHDTRH